MAVTKNKTSEAAAKARKQKIVVGIGGVLLLAVVAIQGPKLWKQLNPPAAAPAATATASPSADVTAVGSSSPLARSSSTVILAGVPISSDTKARRAETGKLIAFTLFKAKDPFVPQVSTTEATTTPAPTSSSPSTAPVTQATGTTASAGEVAPTNSQSTSVPAQKPTFATMEVNGKAEPVELKDKFPDSTPTFVLVGLTYTGAKIGVAGGTIAGGKALPVKMGKKITLVDSATHVRYTLKLVYAGTAPEKVETFTSPARAAAMQTNAP